MNYNEDDDLDLDLLEETTLVPENDVNPSNNTEYDLYLTLKGLLIVEELDAIKDLCSKKEVDRSLPLFVVVDGESKEVGYLRLTLDILLILHTLNPGYTLCLHDGESNVDKEIISPKCKNLGKNLEQFILI